MSSRFGEDHSPQRNQIQTPRSMMSLAAMLNPVEESGYRSPAPTRAPSETGHIIGPPPAAAPPPQKKQKLAKDAPIFSEGKPIGNVRYPPHEDFTPSEQHEMARFNIYPKIGTITTFPRHIPYSSDKKSFLQKTGRDAFEVFQYTFKLSTDDRTHTVMWDYNVGLVRITPFFKCCRYAKTIPGKMLASNPGLKEICHSITGGALAAQGYWMPFDAARALATTFCHPIRHALMPLFGSSFASDCLRPTDEGFGHMIIERGIIELSAREAAAVRSEMTPLARSHDGCSEAYGGISPTPTASEASTRPSTPHFTEPVYTPAMSTSSRGTHGSRKGRGNGKKISYVRQRWGSPAVSEPSERRNGLICSPTSTVYLPSPKSDTSVSSEVARALHRLEIPRSHGPLPLSADGRTRALLSSRALISAYGMDSVATRSSSPSQGIDCYSEDEDGAISPTTIRCPEPRPSHAAVDSSFECSPTSIHPNDTYMSTGIDAHALACRLHELEKTDVQAAREDLGAAFTLWLLHIADEGAIPTIKDSSRILGNVDLNGDGKNTPGMTKAGMRKAVAVCLDKDEKKPTWRKRRAST